MSKLTYGVGINDADYTVKIASSTWDNVKQKNINSKLIWECPFYRKWRSMLERCYSKKYHTRSPKYKDCTVCDEWLTFSSFRAWMVDMDYENKDLDKDLLYKGNRIYSPKTCVFLHKYVNRFIENGRGNSSVYPFGVYLHKSTNKLMVRCKNPFTKKDGYLGLFELHEAEKAGKVYLAKKHEYACRFADLEPNQRIADALRGIYSG